MRFIKKDGRIIPIGAAVGAAAVKGARAASATRRAVKTPLAAAARAKIHKQAEVKVNRTLDLTGLGLSVASGAIAAATFAGGARSLVGGAVASHAIDAVGIGANLASVAKGGGTKGQKLKQAGRQEARNLLVGNAIYGAGLIGMKSNRQAAVGFAKKIIALGRKALRVA
jgi:hypothetical protein